MPEVERSESLRSDGAVGGTQKPRVSFNRDVHIKRIGPRGVQTSPNGSPKTTVRKQRLGKVSDKVLAREAAYVVSQADRVHCKAFPADKFSSLPLRKKSTNSNKIVNRSNSLKSNNRQTPSIFSIFKKVDPTTEGDNRHPSKPVGRSKSDVSDKVRGIVIDKIRKRTGSESEEYLDTAKNQKKQLSPIIEKFANEDYFGKSESVDVIDCSVNQLTNDDLGAKQNKNKKNTNSVFKKIKIDENNQEKKNDKENINPEPNNFNNDDVLFTKNDTGTTKNTLNTQENTLRKIENMVHSSQRPTDKPLLTKGYKVDQLVKKISNETPAEFPYTNLLVPPGTAQYNNNQPFSYTRPSLSPEPNMYNHYGDQNASQVPGHIIYAQVVCNNDSNGINKQTVHTSFTKPKTNSEDDEDLGYEESSRMNVEYFQQDDQPYKSLSDYNTDNDLPISPILRKYRTESFDENIYEHDHNAHLNLPARGMADGMDSKRKESLIEPNLYKQSTNDTTDLSYRRKLLQSRFNSRKLPDLNLDNDDDVPHDYFLNIEKSRHTKNITDTESKDYRKDHKTFNTFTENVINTSQMDDDDGLYRETPRLKSNWQYKNIDVNRKLFLDSQLNNEELSTIHDPIFNYIPTSKEANKSRREEKHSGRFTSHSKNYLKDGSSNQIRNHYLSNPEIVSKDDHLIKFSHDPSKTESYHNSLRRQNKEEKVKNRYNYNNIVTTIPRSKEIISKHKDPERKEKLVDSGIENDYRKDSNGEIEQNNSSGRRYLQSKGHISNESDQDVNSLLDSLDNKRQMDNELKYNKNGDSYMYRYGSRYQLKENSNHASDDDSKTFENKAHKHKAMDEYVYRERSIDDGSLYDPKIDKIPDKKTTTLQKFAKVDKKIQKDKTKTSNLEKVRQLFSSKKQKKDKSETMVKEEDLRARYTEYKGINDNIENQIEERAEKDRSASKTSRHSRVNEVKDYGSRRRLSTPSASPSPPRRETAFKENTGNWFKSLDRLARRAKTRTKSKSVIDTSTPNKHFNSSTSGGSRNASRLALRHNSSPLPGIQYNNTLQKNLRFFGDTDLESNASISKHKTSSKTRPLLDRSKNEKLYSSTQVLSNLNKDKKRVSSLTALNGDYLDGRQNLLMNSYNQEKFSNQNIHNILEIQSETESQLEEPIRTEKFKYMDSPGENIKINRSNMNDYRLTKKPPMSPLKENRKNDKYMGARDTLKMHKSKSDLSDADYRRKRPDIIGGASSIESSTEGESSQQSQNSIVYLHAATVGDIPVPRRRGGRSASKEELSSLNSSRLQPQIKTISRSISVLAPWKPRHIREGYDINYSQMQNNLTNARSKSKLHPSSNINQDLSNKINARNASVHDSATMNRRAKYENNEKRYSNNTMYRKHRDRNSYDNLLENKQHSRIKSDTIDRKKADKNSHSGSIETLTTNRIRNKKIARSISMPRDSRKPAGWFKMTNNNKN